MRRLYRTMIRVLAQPTVHQECRVLQRVYRVKYKRYIITPRTTIMHTYSMHIRLQVNLLNLSQCYHWLAMNVTRICILSQIYHVIVTKRTAFNPLEEFFDDLNSSDEVQVDDGTVKRTLPVIRVDRRLRDTSLGQSSSPTLGVPKKPCKILVSVAHNNSEP